jgi:hypothetical protein
MLIELDGLDKSAEHQ